jgi:hypothetical protein
VSTALVVGLGAVGVRAGRQLVDTDGVTRVLVADRDTALAADVAGVLGERAAAATFLPGDPLPDGLDVVVCALPTGLDHAIVDAAIRAGVPLATADDDHDAIEAICNLSRNAESAGVTIAAGCGLAPGLADVLVKHATSMFSQVDEIRVARTGWAGPASVASVRRERRASVRSWTAGTWREEHPRGEELVSFPEPIGARDCRVVTGGIQLLVEAFPEVPRIWVQLGEPPKRTWMRRRFGDDGEWGAARVEVWGKGDDGHHCVVYGIVERTSVAAGTVLAVTAARLAGVLGPNLELPGVHGLARLVEPVPFLAELAQRGVRAAAFEGVPVA